MVMTQKPMPGPLPEVACQCWSEDQLGDGVWCECGDEERVLRAGAPLTSAQRIWCLEEIAAVEGYDAAQYSMSSDKELGAAVLSAWTDYCRDKGLM